jgi:hypothetical protein
MGFLEPHERHGGRDGEADVRGATVAKFGQRATAWDGAYAESLDSVIIQLSNALPNFKCHACNFSEFQVLDHFDDTLFTVLNFHREGDPIPKKFIPIVSISCLNCGHISQFEMSTLRKLAEQRMVPAGGA